MRYRLAFAALLPLFGLLAPEAWGQTPAPSDSLQQGQRMEAVVVTGTHTPRLLKKLPIPTQVITHEQLDRVQPRSAADALQMTLPGVQLSMHGGQQRVTIQGMDGDYLLFLVNGEKITSEGNGVVDLTRIDVTTIERIEIIRGSASALYGSSAIGAVVNFITKQATRPVQGSLSTDVSSEGVSRYHATAGLRFGRFSSLTSLGYVRQDPYSVQTDDGAGQSFPSIFVGSKTTHLNEELRFQNAPKTVDAKAYIRYSFRDQDKDELTQVHYKSYSLGGNTSWAFSPRNSLRASYNKELYDRSNWFPSLSLDGPIFRFHGHTARLQYNYGAEGETRFFANAGLEYYHESLQGNRFADVHVRRRADLATVYGQGEWRATDRLSLMAGARLDKHSRFGAHLSPRFSALYSLGKWRLRASYSEGFRSPSIKELYMDWDHLGMFFIRGSEDLRPEVSHLISLAPEYQGKRLNATLIASYNFIQHSIELVSEDSGRVQRYRNTDGTTKVLNLQTSLRYQLPEGFSASIDYAYLRSFAEITDAAGRRFSYSNLRPHNLTATLTYERRFDHTTLSASYSQRVSSALKTLRYDPANATYVDTSFPAFHNARLSATASWRGKVRIALGIDNLFNFVPESLSISGSLSPGRTFFSSLTLSL